VVFDTVGGEALDRSWGVLKPGGWLVTIAASMEDSPDPYTREAFFIVRPDRGQLNEITGRIDAAQFRPVVDCVFPLAQAR
jgi:NADPH:quinone reductase-like Zn-dependent oxidoreductase